VPAVVLGLSPTGLAVAGSLGRRGVPVLGVDAERTPAAASRHIAFHRAPPAGTDALLAALEALAARTGTRPVLLPTADEHAAFLDRHHERLAGAFRMLLAPGVARTFSSKNDFGALAARLGLPVPRAVAIGPGGPPPAVDDLRFPLVVKPDESHLWTADLLRAQGLPPAKAVPVADRDALGRLLRRLGPLGHRTIAQEMVMGPDENHVDYQVLVEPGGGVRAEFMGRKLRLSPPHFGLGTYVASCWEEDVAATGREVMARTGYRGVADVNFKRDSRDGSLWLLEVNPRFGLWTSLAVACGVDLPWWTYRSALGLPWEPPAARYAGGRHWMHVLWDARSMRAAIAEGRGGWGGWIREALGADAEAFVSRDDPLPALANAADVAARALRTRLAGRRGG